MELSAIFLSGLFIVFQFLSNIATTEDHPLTSLESLFCFISALDERGTQNPSLVITENPFTSYGV